MLVCRQRIDMAKDANDTLEELSHAGGWEVLSKDGRMFQPAYSIDEVGTCRIAGNPKTGAVDKWIRSDVNFSRWTGGRQELTGGSQNPAMIILPLSMQAPEYLARQRRAESL